MHSVYGNAIDIACVQVSTLNDDCWQNRLANSATPLIAWYYNSLSHWKMLALMSQTRPLLDTLKMELRKQQTTCKQLSQALALSLTGVNPLFAGASLSVKRLETVRESGHMEISDLVYLMDKNIELANQLSIDEERELVFDARAFGQ